MISARCMQLRAASALARSESASKGEESQKEAMLEALADAQAQLAGFGETLDPTALEQLKETLGAVHVSRASKRSTIRPRDGHMTDVVDEHLSRVKEPSSEDSKKARLLAFENLPCFVVYYSKYRNLDS
jgi:hypothetical protein